MVQHFVKQMHSAFFKKPLRFKKLWEEKRDFSYLHNFFFFLTIFLCTEIQNSNVNFGTKKTFPHNVCFCHEIQKSNLIFGTQVFVFNHTFFWGKIQNSNLNFGTKKFFRHYVCLCHEIQKSNLNFDTIKSFPYVNISLKRYRK